MKFFSKISLEIDSNKSTIQNIFRGKLFSQKSFNKHINRCACVSWKSFSIHFSFSHVSFSWMNLLESFSLIKKTERKNERMKMFHGKRLNVYCVLNYWWKNEGMGRLKTSRICHVRQKRVRERLKDCVGGLE